VSLPGQGSSPSSSSLGTKGFGADFGGSGFGAEVLGTGPGERGDAVRGRQVTKRRERGSQNARTAVEKRGEMDPLPLPCGEQTHSPSPYGGSLGVRLS